MRRFGPAHDEIARDTRMNRASDAPLAVITGANRGLGLGTAKALAELGYRLFLVCRGQAAAVGLAKEVDAEVFIADVTDGEAIAAMAAHLGSSYGRVDVLVNNAAIAPDFARSFAEDELEDEVKAVRDTLETNVVGAYRVTRALMPLLAKSAAPRIVNVSSNMGRLEVMRGGSPGYRSSKAALNALTKVWAAELAGTPAKVNSVTPGWVRTDMGGPNADRSVGEGAAGIVWAATLPDDGPTGGFFMDGERIGW